MTDYRRERQSYVILFRFSLFFLREQGRRRQLRRGRPRLRWEDCVKRDVKKAGEEEDWNKKTRDIRIRNQEMCICPKIHS